MSTTLLAARALSWFYEDRPALEDISFELERGRILALIGPNACGKSTLLKVISGLLPLRGRGCTGQVLYLGQSLMDLPPSQRAERVMYVPPDLTAEFPLTVREAVSLGQRCRIPVDEALEICFCWEIRNRDLHTLSGGERQRVMLARAVAQDPKVLLLDESLSKMDLNHQAEMGRVLTRLARAGKAVVIVSHDLNLATEWAQLGLLMKDGQRVAFGPIGEVLTRENVRKLYPGSELEVAPSPATGAPKIYFGSGSGLQ